MSSKHEGTETVELEFAIDLPSKAYWQLIGLASRQSMSIWDLLEQYCTISIKEYSMKAAAAEGKLLEKIDEIESGVSTNNEQ